MSYSMWSCFNILFLLYLILALADGVSLASTESRTCVIGAGYAGLGTARYLQQYGIKFTVFEATKYIGGTWRFDPHVGTDEDGLPLFTSMYKNLRTNTPRETMEYIGFKFPEGTPSFPSGACFYKYVKAYVKHFDLLKNIQFRSLVTSVKWAGDHWDLTYTKVDTRDSYTQACDFVIVANGQYVAAKWPKIEGLDKFKGNMIHSHDYKESEPFRNRRVLLVGAGASGLDLAVHLSNVTSKLVHSHHLVYNQPYFSENYIKKPDIKEFTPQGAVFQDGSAEEFDDVIFCTGFNYDHPFLDVNTTGVLACDKFVLPLHQHIVNINHPTMAFIGITKTIVRNLFDYQGQYVAALIAGKFKLPSQKEMLRKWYDHINSLSDKNRSIADVNLIGDDEPHYFKSLAEEAGVIPAAPVYTEIKKFNAKLRLDDLLNYRDYDYEIIDDYNFKVTYNPRKEENCPFDN